MWIGEEHAVSMEVVVVVPTLNEEKSIVDCLQSLLSSEDDRFPIIVADGGSTDNTLSLVRGIAKLQKRICLLHNAGRTQAHALNMVAGALPPSCKWLVRADAHSIYPADYVDTLLAACKQPNASSVVVSMRAIGTSCFEKAVAYAQNSLLGNGGACHRQGQRSGVFVEHGHHALFDLNAFKAVGGYDQSFRFNEDFELDHRIRAAGGRLWLSEKVVIGYLPRSSLRSLVRQYFNHGSGRAQSVFKHRLVPKPRQMFPIAIFWSYVLAAGLLPATLFSLTPALCHLLLCTGWGITRAIKSKDRCATLMGIAAAAMHVAWGAGFSREIVKLRFGFARPTSHPESDASQQGWSGAT